MPLQIVIDTRETGSVARELDTLGSTYIIEPLSVGDFAIRDENGTLLAVWERKTCADLAASINDGRYAEQKGRLLALNCKWKGFLIEGYYPEKGLTFPKANGKTTVVSRFTIDSVKLGLSLRDGFIVFELADSKHTALFLTNMISKLPEYLNGSASSYEEALIKSISTVRKENMTPEVCYLAQLCQIPGVSHGIAQAIQCKYPNMRALLDASPADLAEIKCTEARKLGKVLAQRLAEYLNLNLNLNPNEPVKIKPVITRKFQ